ncbi:hypothetical protein [Methylobacterium trifolii]|uniref:hypothetical protein n=1 Tax=Methylobacterium trifolii TaxID=1003092 RepID=UPI001EE128DC|nr:hypothetical protein [Methylobacterium trifolii]
MSATPEDEGESSLHVTITPEAIRDVREWLDLKMRTGCYAFGFTVELAYHLVARVYNVHAIYDEIGILEGDDTRRSITKPAEAFKREPLKGFFHKHHYQAIFIIKNLFLQFHKEDDIESVFRPYIGQDVKYFAGPLAYDRTFGALQRRGTNGAMTGEFIVYEKLKNRSNYYLTLGSHGEYQAIRNRIDAYKRLDQEISISS